MQELVLRLDLGLGLGHHLVRLDLLVLGLLLGPCLLFLVYIVNNTYYFTSKPSNMQMLLLHHFIERAKRTPSSLEVLNHY